MNKAAGSKAFEIKSSTSSHSGLIGDGLGLYLATIFPGVYSLVLGQPPGQAKARYIYLPKSIPENPYSPWDRTAIDLDGIELPDLKIPVDDKIFKPIVAENYIIGGICGYSKEIRGINPGIIAERPGISNLIRGTGLVSDGGKNGNEIARRLLTIMSSERSADSFFGQIIDLIVETSGGGTAALYYRSADSFVLRKVAGHLALFDETPALLTGPKAKLLAEAINSGKRFYSVDLLPEYAGELPSPPKIGFAIETRIDSDVDIILTGILPDITAHRSAFFLERLNGLLQAVTARHFAPCPDWQMIFPTIEKLAGEENSRQGLAEYLFNRLSEHVSISHLSLIKYHYLEDRPEVEGSVDHSENGIINGQDRRLGNPDKLVSLLEAQDYFFREDRAAQTLKEIGYHINKEWTRSLLILPMKCENGILGVMIIGSRVRGAYLKKRLPVFKTITDFLTRIFILQKNRHTISIYSRQLDRLETELSAVENFYATSRLRRELFHDMNNILGALVGRCELTVSRVRKLSDDESKHKIVRDLDLIGRCASDMEGALLRLKSLSQAQKRTRRETVNLKVLIDDSIEMVRSRWEQLNRDKDNRIVLKRETVNDADIMVNAGEIREVLTRIMLNSLDSLPNGGEILITCRTRDDRAQVEVRVLGEGLVSDNDDVSGIVTADTALTGESGFDLSISKKIIEENAGTLKTDTESSRDVTYVLELPLTV
jgi:signal transduction histidine kinase